MELSGHPTLGKGNSRDMDFAVCLNLGRSNSIGSPMTIPTSLLQRGNGGLLPKKDFSGITYKYKRDNEKGINRYILPRRISSYFVITFSREYDSFYPTFPQLHFPFSFKSLLKFTIPPFTTKGTFVSQLK